MSLVARGGSSARRTCSATRCESPGSSQATPHPTPRGPTGHAQATHSSRWRRRPAVGTSWQPVVNPGSPSRNRKASVVPTRSHERTRRRLLRGSPAPTVVDGSPVAGAGAPHAPHSSDRPACDPRRDPPGSPSSGSSGPRAQTLAPALRSRGQLAPALPFGAGTRTRICFPALTSWTPVSQRIRCPRKRVKSTNASFAFTGRLALHLVGGPSPCRPHQGIRPILKVMHRRADIRSSSPLLPFSDETDVPDKRRPDRRLPTVFITYSRETKEHNERVLNLAKTLRADGVASEIDSFQVSPPEGWPAWMRTLARCCTTTT